MRRQLITFAIVTTLSIAFRLYSAVIEPLTALQESPQALLPPTGEAGRAASMVINADRDFPDLDWTRDANWEIHPHHDLCIYAQELIRNPDHARRGTMQPVAMLWRDPQDPQAPPLRISAESGELEFENDFPDSIDQKPGRIVAARLNGVVRIDGPDGLVIDGTQFNFSEQTGQLYSDSRVWFEYGPTKKNPEARIMGQGEQFYLKFLPSDEPEWGRDGPKIGQPEEFKLRQNVEINARFVTKGVPTGAKITSVGPFTYFFATREARFETRVVADKWNADGKLEEHDSIQCEWMSVQLDEAQPAAGAPVAAVAAVGGGGGIMDGLTFRRLRALGSMGLPSVAARRLTVSSQHDSLTAMMHELVYDARDGRITMRDEENVLIAQQTSTLECPHIEAVLTETNELDRLLLTGAGNLKYVREELGPEPLRVKWGRSLHVLPDADTGWHLARLDTDAQLSIPGRFDIASGQMQMWLDLKRAMAMEESGDDPLSGPLALQKAVAVQNVVVTSDQLVVQRADYLEAVIAPGTLPPEADGGRGGLGRRGRREESQTGETEQPAFVEADQIALQLVHDPQSERKIDVRRAEGIGNISIVQAREPDAGGGSDLQGPLSISGVRFVVDNEGPGRQTVSVFGELDPQGKPRVWGSVGVGEAAIDGLQVSLSLEENMLRVHGPGRLHLPMTEGLDGAKLEQPVWADVAWSDRMEFDGRTARFWGAVTTSIPQDAEHTSRLLCDQLTARMLQRMSFADPQPKQKMEVEYVEGSGHVEFQAYEFSKESKLTALRRGRCQLFHFTRSTGDFHLKGPGEVHSWSFGETTRLASTGSAAANAPARAEEPKWQYQRLTFGGEADGNSNQRNLVVRYRVELLTAPVDSQAEMFHRERLSEMGDQAANAAWLGCEELQIQWDAPQGQRRPFVRLIAQGDVSLPLDRRNGAELEGQLFRATADVVEYSSREGNFILRGVGKDALLHWRQSFNSRSQSSANQGIIFNPVTHAVQANGSSGLSSGAIP